MQFKTITCATIVTDGQYYLVTHPTGRSLKKGNWDLPKGRVEEGETEKNCAIRELREETSIIAQKKDMHYIGLYPYNKEKDMSLFIFYTKELMDLSKLKCTSSFLNKDGVTIFEMDDFAWATLGEWKMLYSNIQKVISTVEDLILDKIKELGKGEKK